MTKKSAQRLGDKEKEIAIEWGKKAQGRYRRGERKENIREGDH